MKKLTRILLSTLLAGATHLAGAAAYHPGDLLLVFRDGSNPDVEYDLGSVSNYLNQAAGTPIAINYDINAVSNNFGGLSNVSYAVVSASASGDAAKRVWLSANGSVPNSGLSAYNSVYNRIQSVGSSAGAAGGGVWPFTVNVTDTTSYDYVVGGVPGGSAINVDTFGGYTPFVVEAVGPVSTLAFYEFAPSSQSPIPAATQLGNFQMAGNGTLTFTPVAVAPTITAAASNTSATRGGSASFSGAATTVTGGAVSYQWYHNGAAIAGATGSALNLSGLGVKDAGTYTLVATSANGGTTTTSATLAVTPAYSAGDMILVFRDGSNPDVEYDLGSVSNYLNTTLGQTLPVSYDINAVSNNFGGLSNVSYAVVSASASGDAAKRVWLSANGSVPNSGLSAYNSVYNRIQSVGSSAGAAGGGVWPFTVNVTDTTSYDYVVGGVPGGSAINVDTFGGYTPFVVEAVGPVSTLAFYEFAPSSQSPIPAATQLGNFQMAGNGTLTFTPVAVAPTITAAASNTSATRGGSASFSGAATTVTGGAVSYQWYHNGAAIAGATGSALNLSGLGVKDAGTYTLVATSANGGTTTTSATLAVTPAYSAGDMILVFRDGSNPDVEYDLGSVSNYLNQAAGTPIAINYDINAVSNNFGGLSNVSYAVVSASASGDAAKRVWLSANGSVPNSGLSAYNSVYNRIQSVGSSAGAAGGGVWPFTVNVTDTTSYDYVVGGVPGGSAINVDTFGGYTPFVVEAVGPVSTLAFYEFAPSSQSPIPAATQLGNFQMAGNGTLTFTPVAVAPTITAAASNTSATRGGSASFSGAATTVTGGAVSYQWYHNGAAIAGATGSALNLSGLGVKDAGTYTLVATSANGGTTTTSATLAVTPAYSAGDMILVFRDGSNPDVEYDLGSVSNYLNTTLGQTLPVSYDINAVSNNFGGLSNVSYAVVSASASGDVTKCVWMTDADVASAPYDGSYISTAGFGVLRNAIDSVGSSAGAASGGVWPFVDGVSDTSAYDNIVSDGTGLYVDSLGGKVPFTVEAVGPNTFVPLVQLGRQAPTPAYSVVGTFSMAGDGSITFSNATVSPVITASLLADRTVNGGSSTTFSVTASYASGYQWLKNGSAISGATGSALTLSGVTSAKNGSYSVVVSNALFHTSTTSAAASLTVIDPCIVTGPANVSVLATSNAVFSVTASGTSPLSYQWRVTVGATTTNLPGQTSASLTVSSTKVTMSNYLYSVVVTNVNGAVTSAPAKLSVVGKAVTVSAPANKAVFAGQPAVFSTTVTGGAAPTYQWYKGSSPISGATSASYTNTQANFTDAGSYYVAVSDATLATPLNSASATLTVNVPESIKTQPAASTTKYLGQPFGLSVVVQNLATTPLVSYANTYQWYSNNVAISGATSAIYTNALANTNDAGSYKVVVGYSYGSVSGSLTSAVANVTLNIPEKISTQPVASTTKNQGQPFTLKVVVGNNTTLAYTNSYQWYSNGAAISGAKFASYTNTAPNTNDAGSYKVIIGYGYGPVFGMLTSAVANVSIGLDTNPPAKPTFTYPKASAQLTNNIQVIDDAIIVTGTATDPNSGNVSNVFVKLNNGSFQPANVTNSPTASSVKWGLVINPAVGTNTVYAYTVDFAGNVSTNTNSLSFFFAVPTPVTVNITGNGGLTKPGYFDSVSATQLIGTNQFFVNRTYTLTATNAHNYLFTNWVNNTDNNTPWFTNVYTFTVETNLTLTVNFVTNRFVGAAGTYNGLFTDTNNGVGEASAGWFTATVTPSDSKGQSFSATLFVDGDTIKSISGSFDLSGKGTTTKPVTRPGKGTLALSLQLDFDNNTLGGTVSNTADVWNSTLSGDLSVYSATSNTPYAGTYNLLIPGFTNAADGPTGYGYATVTIAAKGTVTPANATLADGQTFTPQTAPVAANGDWPVYAPVYAYAFNTGSNTVKSYQGAVLGWLNFSNGVPTGSLFWIKTAGWTNGYYTGGFTNESSIYSSAVTNPVSGLLFSNTLVTLEGGNLLADVTNHVTISNAVVKFIGTTNALMKLTFTQTTDLAKGTYKNAVTGQTNSFSGLYLPDQKTIGGFFLDNTNAGSLLIQ